MKNTIRTDERSLLRASWRYLVVVGPPITLPRRPDGAGRHVSTILEGAARSAPPALFLRRVWIV
eukprot:7338151-Prymnesium_polylepis.1